MKQTPDDLVAAIVHLTTTVESPIVDTVVVADPSDDIFLACANAAGAKYLVTGDRHLLNVQNWRGIQIVTVNDFLEEHFPERM